MPPLEPCDRRASDSPTNARTAVYIQPCTDRATSIFEHIIGVKVKATNPETITAADTAKANSRNNLPVLPLIYASGAKTVASVKVIAITAKAISRLPSNAALIGATPCSIRR